MLKKEILLIRKKLIKIKNEIIALDESCNQTIIDYYRDYYIKKNNIKENIKLKIIDEKKIIIKISEDYIEKYHDLNDIFISNMKKIIFKLIVVNLFPKFTWKQAGWLWHNDIKKFKINFEKEKILKIKRFFI